MAAVDAAPLEELRGSMEVEGSDGLSSVSARLAKSRFMVSSTKCAKSSCLTPRSVLA